LIGVIARPEQLRAVEEFFQLFKTPWELFRSGTAYDVVIATAADDLPEIAAKLILLCGPGRSALDSDLGVLTRRRYQHAIIGDGDVIVPIYRELATFDHSGDGSACLMADSEVAGVHVRLPSAIVIRLGYDLFNEVQALISTGQPAQFAHIPTLDRHIAWVRNWILGAGVPLLEIPAVPAGFSFAVCLTHDIDFVGIRRHRFDHSMWGFVYRATVGALSRFGKGRLKLSYLLRGWLAVASLPFVYVGWVRDFWEPFAWYLRAEAGLAATYFLIPFRRRAGENVPGKRAALRAAAYDIRDVSDWVSVLLKSGCEIGVHGLDAWHSSEKGREELTRIAEITENQTSGIRMHWLLTDARTPSVLEQAGYAYDSTCGYNETIGYRAGTTQVFRPSGAHSLLELPLHIQDGALFYPQRLDLSEPEAASRCQEVIDNAARTGGVVTILWHDRSHGPERFWGDFYVKLTGQLLSLNCWFGTASQVVGWFRKRREARFERVPGSTGLRVRYEGGRIEPPLIVRIYTPVADSSASGSSTRNFVETVWTGQGIQEVHLPSAADFSCALPRAGVSDLS
jgi:hypothetical protein